MADNIITAVFGATRETKVRPRYRYDVGQVLMVRGVKNLPDFYEVHFANEGSTADATPLIGTTDGVTIPDTYFQSGATIYAYIYVHDEATDGTTVYKVTIPIINRARPANVEPTPEEADIISQAIVALNENVGRSEDAAEQAEESAETALSAADGAAQAERNAGTHADRAEAAQRAAETAEDNAGTSATQAQAAAQSAEGSASDAADYMRVALDAANSANSRAASAEQASNTARGYATQAETAKVSAETAKTDAQIAKTQALGYKQSAESAANRAASAATSAGNAQTAAETAQTAAETAESNAQTYAGQASQSATNAGQSATSAAQTLTQVQNEGASQIAAIDAEGQRVLDSIPADYSQMEADVTDLKSQTNDYHRFIFGNPELIKNASWVEGASISESGAISTNANFHYTDLIPVDVASYLFVYKGTGVNSNTRVHGYDSSGNWVKQIIMSASGTLTSPISVAVDVGDGISYIRISANKGIDCMVLAKKVTADSTIEKVCLEMEYVLNTKSDIMHVFELSESSKYIDNYLLLTYQALGKTIDQIARSQSSYFSYYKIDVSNYEKVFFPCFKSSSAYGEIFVDEDGIVNAVYTNGTLDGGTIVSYDLPSGTKYMYVAIDHRWSINAIAFIGVISTIKSGGGSGTIIVHDDSYPSLTASEKQQIVTLCDNYFDMRTQFSYGGTRYRNQYIDTGCISDNKFLINCGMFAQFIWMGRQASDFNLSNYTNQIHKAFDWGYYFDFAIHKAIYGLAKSSSGTDAQKYYGYQAPSGSEPYAFNAYTDGNAMVWRYFMAAADLAEELYNMGCEVPRRAAEVGDLVFYRGPEYSGMSLETQLNFRNISHVGVITDIDYMGSGRMRTTEVTFWSDLGTVAHLSINESDNSDKTRAGFYENRIVMIARHPHAFGIPTNVPDFITAI